MLDVHGLRSHYGRIQALAGIDLQVGDAWFHRLRELASVHAVTRLGREELYTPSILGLLDSLEAVTREQYLASFAAEERLARDLRAAMEGYDALLTPANPWPGLRWGTWRTRSATRSSAR